MRGALSPEWAHVSGLVSDKVSYRVSAPDLRPLGVLRPSVGPPQAAGGLVGCADGAVRGFEAPDLMRTLVLDKPGRLALTDTPAPADPGPGQALVRVHRVGVCGTDINAFGGNQPFFTYPRILGHELGVEVVAVGEGVANVAPGDRAAVEPYLNCGTCAACAHGCTNCCETLTCMGVHGDGGEKGAKRGEKGTTPFFA